MWVYFMGGLSAGPYISEKKILMQNSKPISEGHDISALWQLSVSRHAQPSF